MTETPHPLRELATDYLTDLHRRGEMDIVYQNASGILNTYGRTELFNPGNKNDTSVPLKITPPVNIIPEIQLRLREGDRQVEDIQYVDGVFVGAHNIPKKDPDVVVLEAQIEGTNSWATFARFKKASVNDWTGQRVTAERLNQITLTIEQLGLYLHQQQEKKRASLNPDFEDGHHV